MKRVIIVGASSGIGAQVAHKLLEEGYVVGIAARRIELLDSLVARYPDNCIAAKMDVNTDEAIAALEHLLDKMGGADTLLISSGIGWQNPELDAQLEMRTVKTNVEGFVRVADYMFNYFRSTAGGHIAAITSVAGTRGIGVAPAYSSSKRFQRHYLDSLAQLSRMENLNIAITDIRPGFVAADSSAIVGEDANGYVRGVKKRRDPTRGSPLLT